jgi:hypothetical protein
MSDQRPKREFMSIEEATVSNMWEIAAIVELLERKGLCTKSVFLRKISQNQQLLGNSTNSRIIIISP